MGLDADELRGLWDGLWAMCDAFPEGGNQAEGDLGEDEEQRGGGVDIGAG